MRLLAAPQPRQVEMHPDHAQLLAVEADVGHHRAARLERGEMEQLLVEHVDILPHQQGVAVPADASVAGVEGDRLIVAMLLDHVQRDRARPGPEPPVGLLQGDHVGVELAKNLERPLRPPPPIGADRLSHIVAGDADHERQGTVTIFPAPSHGFPPRKGRDPAAGPRACRAGGRAPGPPSWRRRSRRGRPCRPRRRATGDPFTRASIEPRRSALPPRGPLTSETWTSTSVIRPSNRARRWRIWSSRRLSRSLSLSIWLSAWI